METTPAHRSLVYRHFVPQMHWNALFDCRSYRMEKHMFGILCLDALSVESILVPPKHEN
jgi:hypothetical protein